MCSTTWPSTTAPRSGDGLDETLTVTRLGIRGALRKTLASTNPCESMIECGSGAPAATSEISE